MAKGMIVAPQPEAVEAGRRIYFNESGDLWGPGSRVTNPDMAQSLIRIQEGGADVFYKGAMAEEIAADMEKHGGYNVLRTIQERAYRVFRNTNQRSLLAAPGRGSLNTKT